MLPVTERDGLRIIRPLLETPRDAIENYATVHGLTTRLDATNADRTYTRNRVRLEILPVLRGLNPAIDDALAHTAELARAEYEALLWALGKWLVDWPRSADWLEFKALPLGLQRLAIHQVAPEWSFDQVEALVDWLAHGRPGEWRIFPEGARIQLTFDRIEIDSTTVQTSSAWPTLPDGPDDNAIVLALPGTVELTNGWRLSAAPLATSEMPQWDTAPWTDPLHTALAVPPGAAVAVRRCRVGDRFAPRGLGGHTQKLSDTLTNLKVPAAWRARLPLLTIHEQIAWFVAPTPDGLRGRVSETFALHGQGTQAWNFYYEHDPEDLPG
jgi:tRNA(Ile)-lysidine synthase